MDADDLRFELSSPQSDVFALARAQLTGDQEALTELFELIDQGNAWRLVAVIAVAELTQELHEHRGEDAKAWLDERITHGLDPS